MGYKAYTLFLVLSQGVDKEKQKTKPKPFAMKKKAKSVASAPAIKVEAKKPVRYSRAELGEFKTLIDIEMEKNKKVVDEARETLENVQVSRQIDSATSEPTIREEAVVKRDRAERMMGHLTNALVRIVNGTYGICYQCGEPHLIEKDRIQKALVTTKCMEAKRREEAGKRPGAKQLLGATQ